MVALALVAVPIAIVIEIFKLSAILIKSDIADMGVFDQYQLDSFAFLFLKIYDQGTFLASIFWGLWLLPFGLLVIKSKFIPKIIGIFLVIGCFSYYTLTLTI
jgi:hypothetical protein